MFQRAPFFLAAIAFLGCGEPKVELVVPLTIINFAPSRGATSVDPSSLPTVCFSLPMDAARASGKLTLELEGGGAAPGQSLAATADEHCLSIAHDALQRNTGYHIRALQGLSAADGQVLATEIASDFRTAAK